MAEATPETPQKEAADIVQEPVPSPLEPATEFQVLNSHLEEAGERLARSTHLSPQSLRDWLVNDLCPIFGDMMKTAEWYVLDLNMRASELEENADRESEDSLTPELGAQIIEFIGRTVQLFGAIAPMLQAQNPQLLEELQLLVAVAPGLLSNVQDAIVLEEYEDEDDEEEDEDEGDEEEDEEEGDEEQPEEPSPPALEPVVDTSKTADPVVDTSETVEPITDTSGEEKSDGAEAPAQQPAAEDVSAAAEPTAVEQMQEGAHVDPKPEPIETPAETSAEAPAEPVTETETETETPAEEPEAKPEEGTDG
jgi:hypothetical protein